MTDNQKISNWIASKDKNWQEGLSLLSNAKGKRNTLRVLMARGKTPKSIRTLSYELGKLVKGSAIPAISKTPIEKPLNRQHNSNLLNRKNDHLTESQGNPDNDPALAALFEQRNFALKQYQALKFQLEYMSKAERKVAALRILKYEKDRISLNRKIEYYQKFGMLPPSLTDNTEELDPYKLKLRIDNLRSRISKDKKAVAAAQSPASKNKWENDLAKHSLELESLLKKIPR